MTRDLHVFKANVTRQFDFLKAATSFIELTTRAIPLPQSGGSLLPLAQLHTADDALISLLAEWRAAHQQAFPTRFPVTEEGTRSWLTKRLLEVPDRLLFLVVNRFGEKIGHLGLANAHSEDFSVEIDNVVRGKPDLSPGIMSEALCVLVDWSHKNLWPEKIVLRVFQDNEHALRFYTRNGFKAEAQIPLRRKTNGSTESYSELAPGDAAPADAFFCRMAHDKPLLSVPAEPILTAGPSIGAQEIVFGNDAIRNGWNNQWAAHLKAFESEFASYVGVKHALATSSCTGALHIALAALGIGPGDEVIVPDITWVATANAVLYVGATPIFADVLESSWCLDPASFERLITPRTKAVMPVHLYGHPADMGEIMRIARAHGLYVVEDAAPSIGAMYAGQRTGSFGDFACFSFQGAKLAVTGEGGMLVTSNPALYEKAYSIWDQGRKPGTFWIQSNGLKYKMANVVAAIGRGQLQRNDAMVEAKRRIFRWYDERLRGCPHVRLNHEVAGCHSIYWMTSIRVLPSARVSRDDLIRELKNVRIDTRPVFPAISQYPIWPTHQAAQPNALAIGQSAINLPSGVCLREEQVDYVCRSIRKFLPS